MFDLKFFSKILSKLNAVGVILSKIFLFAMIFIFGFEVLMRYVFNRPTGYADQLSEYFLSGLVLMGIANTFKQGGHVRVEIFYNLISEKYRRWIDSIICFLAIVPIAVLIYLSYEIALQFYMSGRLSFSSSLQIPLWIPICMIPIGLFLLICELIEQFLLNIFRKVK